MDVSGHVAIALSFAAPAWSRLGTTRERSVRRLYPPDRAADADLFYGVSSRRSSATG